MSAKSANERTFQGELYRIIHRILEECPEIQFSKVSQEEQVGTGGKSRFSDGKIYSKVDKSKNVFIELKNSSWDATDEILINDAAQKAYSNGVEYFVTGTPRQLVIFQTFKPNTTLAERKLKSYIISNVKKDDEILLASYEKTVYAPLKTFLKELSDLVHGVKEIRWDTIDRIFVNKLSAYILEASAEMLDPMYERISSDDDLRKRLRTYLTAQDLFNVSVNFTLNDVYNLCQLANYLLYLKIMFYNYLERDVPKLGLRPLEIPVDKNDLNRTLRARFDDVLKHDFELIFSENVLDEFEFEQNYIRQFKQNVDGLKRLDYKQLDTDIIGSIYNTLIDNQEQHDRGQHFTNTYEVDIVNAFCIKADTQYIIDTSCGAGTFLVRGYHFLKKYAELNQDVVSHEALLERVWGIEIAAFPTFLATMNLCLQDVSVFDNYPKVIHSDFLDVEPHSTYHGFHLNRTKGLKVSNISGKKADVTIPDFDACVGNPPYIRQELIQEKDKWNGLALREYGLKKINQQSDLYVYYLMHTAAFLKQGGRLGYVISSSWLDVSFGRDLQDFILKNFKIIAIIDNQNIRSFDTASVNTVILIIEKCSDKNQREANHVKFVRVYADYPDLIGSYKEKAHFEQVTKFVANIENGTVSKDIKITTLNQLDLQLSSVFEEKYENGHWGAKYLRSPDIYHTIIQKAGKNLIPLSQVCEVKYGIKTGANDFFYLEDHTQQVLKMNDDEYYLKFGKHKVQDHKTWEKFGWYYSELTKQHHIIEKFYTKPVFKSAREARNLAVSLADMKFCVLMCDKDKNFLFKTKAKILDYINEAERLGIHTGESVKSRKIWYDLSASAAIGDFIFPSKIGEKYRLIDNQQTQVYCDKVNYAINVNDKSENELIFCLMNSIYFRFMLDLFSRQLTGSQTLSDVDVNVVERALFPNPKVFTKKEIEVILAATESLKNREQLPIQKEVHQKDRQVFEHLVLTKIGLSKQDIEELLNEASKYVQDRKEKSDSVVTTKTKGKLSYEDSLKLVRERFPEVRNLLEMVEGFAVKKYIIPEWKAKFPKQDKGGTGEMFSHYRVYFKQGDTQKTLDFENESQLILFEWLYETLDLKGLDVYLPTDAKKCQEILPALKFDFTNYFPQIRSQLKTSRSSANPLQVYRELVLG